MKAARFRIYEVEHGGDESAALSELQRIGATDITVESRDRDEEESILVSCKLPDTITSRAELEAAAPELCL